MKELSIFDGERAPRIYISILGQVYDVTRGRKHYGIVVLALSAAFVEPNVSNFFPMKAPSRITGSMSPTLCEYSFSGSRNTDLSFEWQFWLMKYMAVKDAIVTLV